MASSTVSATKGIRYASAERFSEPVLNPYVQGDELGVSGPISPQVPGMLEQMLGQDMSQSSEDCLYLDVYAPTNPSDTARPVLVWIHGGAYVNGAGSLQWYDGTRLAERGVVVVSINYRLGAFGFLGDRNLGTLDQIAALQWVNTHIAQFGGDPNNVTIFGESAGGSAVVSLMAAPGAAPLFHKAWALSPSILQLRNMQSAAKWEREFLAAAEVESVEEAKALSVEKILEAQSKVLAMPSAAYDMFAPTGGGVGLPDDIVAAAAKNSVPFCVGTNRDESLLFMAFDPNLSNATTEQWVKMTTDQFGERADAVRSAYEVARPGATPLQLLAAVATDRTFRRPAQKLCEQRAEHGTQSWMYWFTWASPAFGGVLGSAHAIDIPFAFDNLRSPGSEMLLGDVNIIQPLATRFADEIVAFASQGSTSWNTFDLTERATMRLDTSAEHLSDPEPELRVLHF